MIIRLTYLASAFSLAAASKSGKTPGTPAPSNTAKAKTGKSTSSKSSKASGDYFIAPFSCPNSCISADHYVLNHLLDAVSECDASDEYQTWNVHQIGTFLKFELQSSAQYYGGMCLAVVHPNPSHESNRRLVLDLLAAENGFIPGIIFSNQGQPGSFLIPWGASFGSLTEDDVDEMCNGHLGLVDCDHPGSYWYNTGGQYLSALCWNQGVSAVMSVDESCTDLMVTNSTDLTTSETFMLLNSE